MANKNKKELTTKQELVKNRALQWTCFGGEILTMLIPFITLAIVNFKDYFVQVDGYKVGLGFALALGVAGVILFVVSTAKVKEEIKTTPYLQTLITTAIVLFIIGIICYLLESIFHDLFLICTCGAAGIVVACFEEKLLTQHFKKKADIIKEVMKEVDLKDSKNRYEKEKEKILEKAKQEKEKKGLI